MRYLQDKVWNYLRKHPESRVQEVAAGIRHSKKTLSHMLNAMRRNGTVRNNGLPTHRSRWSATDKKPVCQMGLHVNSLVNMQKTLEERQALLRLAFLAKGLDPDLAIRKPQIARDTCALAQCWKPSRAPTRLRLVHNQGAGGRNTPVRNDEAA